MCDRHHCGPCYYQPQSIPGYPESTHLGKTEASGYSRTSPFRHQYLLPPPYSSAWRPTYSLEKREVDRAIQRIWVVDGAVLVGAMEERRTCHYSLACTPTTVDIHGRINLIFSWNVKSNGMPSVKSRFNTN